MKEDEKTRKPRIAPGDLTVFNHDEYKRLYDGDHWVVFRERVAVMGNTWMGENGVAVHKLSPLLVICSTGDQSSLTTLVACTGGLCWTRARHLKKVSH